MEQEDVPVYTEVDTSGLLSWIDESPELTAQLRLPLTHWPHPSWHPDADSQWILPPPSPTANTNPYLAPNSPPTVSATSPAENTPPVEPITATTSPEPTPSETTTPENPPQDPPTQSTPSLALKDTLYTLQTRLITALYTAIASKNTEVVHLLITRGFVSPDVTSSTGCTPLIAAVSAGNGSMVCLLVSLGATVNAYGRDEHGKERTPLMVAAAQGRLPLVKLLKEDFGADDAVIAPDGQLALRLAADAGHREVVAYLPSRRGGEWRRWKAHHHVVVRRVKRAGWDLYRFGKFWVWDLPRFFLWSVPKHVLVKPLWKTGKYCWENKGRFGGWCKRQAKEMPGRVKRGAEKVWKGVKKAPGKSWKVMKKVPMAMEEMVKAMWKVIKRIPAAMKVVGMWILDSLMSVGKAVGNVFLRIVSAIHTALMAVLDFFRRTTLKDVWNGICDVFEAVFVKLPKAIWGGIKAAGDMALKVLEGMFGCIGWLIWMIFKGLLWTANFVPAQLWKMICAIGSSMAKGYHEMRVWFNPKH
ncbi:ankyrin repeat domain-containing protein 50 [Podospora aff. communis PSN243]|uniref:Ankyrin repeat domain-containing protein 50 n=1 Tax=Podospora aff. communis PSN243 TaxID=3040156 RepID=A0AAV9GRR3_9PEZI|nr:ankyrin repeat domain-containing protein 50 [Podospora aff. communis PSN243]